MATSGGSPPETRLPRTVAISSPADVYSTVAPVSSSNAARTVSNASCSSPLHLATTSMVVPSREPAASPPASPSASSSSPQAASSVSGSSTARAALHRFVTSSSLGGAGTPDAGARGGIEEVQVLGVHGEVDDIAFRDARARAEAGDEIALGAVDTVDPAVHE